MDTKLKTTKDISKALNAYKMVVNFSESELETLEILANQENKNLVFKGLEESKNNKVYPLRSIL